MKIKFTTTTIIDETDVDVEVHADITPGDDGGLHCPPSGPIPEIFSVVVDGTQGPWRDGDDVVIDLDEDAMALLEDAAIVAYNEQGGPDDVEPPDEDFKDSFGRASDERDAFDVAPYGPFAEEKE